MDGAEERSLLRLLEACHEALRDLRGRRSLFAEALVSDLERICRRLERELAEARGLRERETKAS
jgi:DNA-binding Lrp family transcriptional regulator